ncbi:hypothetical protein Vafri_9178, partial [Volvox africanus]
IVGSCNTLHGALLQSATLLETAAAETGPDLRSDTRAPGAAGGGGGDMLRVALPPLAHGAWMADPRFGCSALGCALMQAASVALRLLPPSRCSEFRAEVAALTKVCRQAVSFEPPSVQRQRRAGAAGGDGRGSVNVFATDFPDPMRSNLMKAVVQLWLGPALICQAFRSSSPSGFFLEGLLHQLRSCLGSYLYDTRAAALKSFVCLLMAINSGAAALSSINASALQSQQDGSAEGAVPQPAAAAVAAAIATGTGRGAVDAGGKMPRLVADLLAHPAQLHRLVSEGMTLLWEAVASEPVHKVIRRALKALGLLHAISNTLTAIDTNRAPDQSNMGVLMSLDLLTAASPAIARSSPATLPTVIPAEAPGRWAPHPLGCLCCGDPRKVNLTASAAADLAAALSHVALVRRLLTEGCNELEARCEALRCLGRALGSAMLAAGAAAAAAKMYKVGGEGQLAKTRSAGAVNAAAAAPPPLLAALGSFLEQVATATQPWQPEDWRLAGAEALAASRLLQSAVRAPNNDGAAAAPPPSLPLLPLPSQQGQPSEVVLGDSRGSLELLAIRGWRCVIAFLEDEDHAVRYTTARLAQEVMELVASSDEKTPTSHSLTSDEPSLPAAGGNSTVAAEATSSSRSRSGGSKNVGVKEAGKGAESTVCGTQPLYVEAVIRRVYSWLAMQYGRCDDGGGGGGGNSDSDGKGVVTRTALVEVLCELVSGCIDEDGGSGALVPEIVVTAAASAGAAATAGWSSQARRLFDKEADNPHEEPILTAQIAARTLRALLAGPQQLRLTSDGGSRGYCAGDSGSVVPTSASTAATLETAAVLSADGSARLARWGAVAVEHLSAVAAAVAVASGTAATGSDVPAKAGGGDGDNSPPEDGWLGGFVNHPEVFTCAYKALLALWTLGPVRHQVAVAAGAELDYRLTAALQALTNRHDVRVSQLAPLLLAVVSEWVGGTTSLQEAELEDIGKDLSFLSATPQRSNILFLL